MPLNATTEDSSGKMQSDCADQVSSDKETTPNIDACVAPLHHYTDTVYHAVFSSVVNAATNLAS